MTTVVISKKIARKLPYPHGWQNMTAFPRRWKARTGNGQPKRRVVCETCQRQRSTTSTYPYCSRCRKEMKNVQNVA